MGPSSHRDLWVLSVTLLLSSMDGACPSGMQTKPPTSPLLDACVCRCGRSGNPARSRRVYPMKVRELDVAAALLTRLLQAEGLESVYARRIRQIQREVVAIQKAGKVPTRRLVRIVGLISEVAADALLKQANGWK